jgi:hypothetical protein
VHDRQASNLLSSRLCAGTQGLTKLYRNPHTAGFVIASMSSVYRGKHELYLFFTYIANWPCIATCKDRFTMYAREISRTVHPTQKML